MEKFLLEKQKELESKLLEHRKILEEQEEYEKLLKFCEDYLGWKDGELNSKGKKVSTMTALSPLVFTEAEVMKEGPIAIRLTDDLFAEMTVPRAMEFSQKKLKLLKMSAKEEMESYLEELFSGDKKMKPAAIDALSTVTVDVVRGLLKAAAKDAELSSNDTVTEEHVKNTFSMVLLSVVVAAYKAGLDSSNKTRNKLASKIPSLSIPDVATCPNGQRYIVNHVIYMCLSKKQGKQKTLIPTGCSVKNRIKSKQLNLGGTHKNSFFLYKCVREDDMIKYKPISCMLNKIEVSPGDRVKSGRVEYYCGFDKEAGHMTLTERKYLHNLCSLGNKNASLTVDDPYNCPGLTTSIYHSDYGSGTVVYYDSEKQILSPSNGQKTKH